MHLKLARLPYLAREKERFGYLAALSDDNLYFKS